MPAFGNVIRDVRFGVAGDPTLTANQVRPAQGQVVVAQLTLRNSGGSPAQFTITGGLYRSGDLARLGTQAQKQGNFFTSRGGTEQTASGSIPAGGTVTVTMYSGPIAYANQIDWAGTAAVGLLDAAFLLTVNGQTTQWVTLNSVVMPQPAPANVQITGITYSVA